MKEIVDSGEFFSCFSNVPLTIDFLQFDCAILLPSETSWVDYGDCNEISFSDPVHECAVVVVSVNIADEVVLLVFEQSS